MKGCMAALCWAKMGLLMVACSACFGQGFRITMPWYPRMIPAEPYLACAGLWEADIGIMGSPGRDDQRTYSYASFDPPLERLNLCQIFNGDASIGYHFTEHGMVIATMPFFRVKGEWADDRQHEQRGVGNMNIFAAMTLSDPNYSSCDYIDCTVGMGIVLPTAEPPGGAGGVPFMGTVAAGILDWLTAGVEADMILFFSPMASRQFNAHWFFKADHVLRGLSIVGGYSYSNQDAGYFPWCDELGPAWSMHTMHWAFTYDLSETNHPWLPYLQLVYDRVLSGKNVLKNSMVGLYVGALF
jgi:hypothetical protein